VLRAHPVDLKVGRPSQEVARKQSHREEQVKRRIGRQCRSTRRRPAEADETAAAITSARIQTVRRTRCGKTCRTGGRRKVARAARDIVEGKGLHTEPSPLRIGGTIDARDL